MEIPESFVFETLGRQLVEAAVLRQQLRTAQGQLAAAMQRVAELEQAMHRDEGEPA